MPIAVFASAKGSPGVTTLAVGVAARWPRPRGAVLVEADPRGGDLAARFGLGSAPGLASMATDVWAGQAVDSVDVHLQRLPGLGAAALLAPGQPRPAAAAARAAVDATVFDAIGRDRWVLVDAGAVHAGSPAIPICAVADLIVLVVGDRVEDLVHAAAAPEVIGDDRCGGLVVAVRRTGGMAPREVARQLGLRLFAEIPSDRLGAAVLSGRAIAVPAWTRLRLPRAAEGLARRLAQLAAPPVAAPAERPAA